MQKEIVYARVSQNNQPLSTLSLSTCYNNIGSFSKNLGYRYPVFLYKIHCLSQ